MWVMVSSGPTLPGVLELPTEQSENTEAKWETIDAPEDPAAGLRGAVTGILLGCGLWVAIIALVRGLG
jgi:hypothetical protein